MPRYHTHAAIVATGDELAIGQSLNTNSKWLADRLMSVGVETVEHVIVGDDVARLVATLRRLVAEVPLIIITGGLGPTLDDITRQALAEVMGDTLVVDAAALEALVRSFAVRGRVITDNQRLQALRPSRAVCLRNDNGTAPGLHGAADGVDIFCVPGPPRELHPMFERDIAPSLRLDPGRTVRTRLLHVIGLGEGDAASRLGDLMARTRSPLVGITAAGAVLTVRIRAVAPAPAEVEAQLAQTESLVRQALGSHIFGAAADTLEGTIVAMMGEQGRTLATIESCTAGALGAMLTRIAGASDIYLGGWVTYSNELKQRLVGVPREMIETHGAVSEPVARAMAVGGLERSGATDCLSITGIAGPGGGTDDKPVGTVYIGRAWRDAIATDSPHPATEVRRFLITGDRADIRERSARSALAMLYFGLTGTPAPEPGLLWEQPGPLGPRGA